MSEPIVTESMIEAGAKALLGDDWETKATIANKKYCREKAKAVYLAMHNAPWNVTDFLEARHMSKGAGRDRGAPSARPLRPHKRTNSGHRARSASCQNRTCRRP
jgi:hypothetical protein